MRPDVQFVGFEFVSERVLEGQRVLSERGCLHAKLLQRDLTHPDFILPEAQAYFIYDYGTVPHIRATLKQIEKIADSKKVTLVARGKGTRSLIDHEFPWLMLEHQAENFSIYR